MTSSAAKIVELYERHARVWDDARRTARPHGELFWIKRFLEIAGPRANILDLGCGSGEPIARDILAAGRQVTGVDSSPSLISLCRDRFPEGNWIVADMRGLDLTERFQGILAWHSFFHLTAEDQEGMFDVFAAHAHPGAALMFTSGSKRGETIGSWQGEPLYHASLAPEKYESLLERHGFRLVEHVVDDANCGGATIWLAEVVDVR